jgi:hypothetical protein
MLNLDRHRGIIFNFYWPASRHYLYWRPASRHNVKLRPVLRYNPWPEKEKSLSFPSRQPKLTVSFLVEPWIFFQWNTKLTNTSSTMTRATTITPLCLVSAGIVQRSFSTMGVDTSRMDCLHVASVCILNVGKVKENLILARVGQSLLVSVNHYGDFCVMCCGTVTGNEVLDDLCLFVCLFVCLKL